MKILITGAGGCIGAWILHHLIATGDHTPIACDINPNRDRLRLLCEDPATADAIPWHGLDITDAARTRQLIATQRPDAIIHLAALQAPFCKADPAAGARVNVMGTLNLFQTARDHGIRRIAYASSVAATAMESPSWLQTLYGAYKLCNEHTARVYWQDHRLPSIGIRPSVIYGAARDQGMSAHPTRAILAACADRPYTIPFTGPVGFVYAPQAAAAFLQAVTSPSPPQGALVHGLNGASRTVDQFIAAIRTHHPRANIRCTGSALPFPSDLSDAPLAAQLGALPEYEFTSAITATSDIFARRLRAGRLNAAAMLAIPPHPTA